MKCHVGNEQNTGILKKQGETYSDWMIKEHLSEKVAFKQIPDS